MNTWRENPDRRALDTASEGTFELEQEEGVTVAATRGGDIVYSAVVDGRGDRIAALASAGAVPKWRAIAMHPATWVVGAVLLGLGLRKVLKR